MSNSREHSKLQKAVNEYEYYGNYCSPLDCSIKVEERGTNKLI